MKIVALVDHYTEGHHKAFVKLFSKYLIKAGYSVFVFFPAPEDELQKELTDESTDSNRVRFINFKLKRKYFHRLGRFNHAASVVSLWQSTHRALKDAEKRFDIAFDFVFLAWLDDYLANYLPPVVIDMIFPYPWSGLYFHPWYLFEEGTTSRVSWSSIDSVLRAKKCLSIALHDDFLIDRLSTRIGKRVLLFPEIADATPPLTDYDLAMRIKTLANGRIVVGLIGLARRKGTLHLMALARQADPSRFFFFLGGRPSYVDCSPEEATALREFFSNLPDHCYHFPESIEEGGKINAVINALDILFLVYHNFKSSSNFSTKAAHFRKPVLATNQYWIGEVTKKFSMGITVDEGNVSQAVRALESLRTELLTRSFDFSRYDDYLLIHREENLTDCFTKAFSGDA